MEDLRQALLQRWEYEEWANGEWLKALPNFQNSSRAASVFKHIYSCYSGWAHYVSDWPKGFDVELNVDRDAPLLNVVWRKVINESDLDSSFDLSDKGKMKVLDLIQHVMNHGTYHRGHLRGLAEAEGLKDFPETDYARFVLSVKNR